MSAQASVEPISSEPVSAAAPVRLGGDLLTKPSRGPWRIAFDNFKRSKLAVLGVIILALMVIISIFAGYLAPYAENEIDLFNITAQPSPEHRLGTDELGRDELSRLMFGGRISLSVGVGAALISAVLGIVVGAISGYYGGWADTILMRFVDLMLAFPAIFLLLIMFAMYGSSVLSVVIFLGVFSWMWLARVIRGEFMSLKQRDFVEAARAIGVPDGTIIRRHLLPNVAAAIIVATTLNVAYAMLSEATLSFLGFGVPPETPTWGNMLNAARPYFITVPLLAIAPGLTLTIAVLAINFVGDGLRDAFDPRGRRR
ncbi:MAG: ABC transporter permease [Thermomicrobiales bacterium]|nr:ABC transporter permease [Thermomicrobiales bacterium]